MLRIQGHRSPNQNARPKGVKPSLIVLHSDGGETDAGTIAWILDPASEVSYHYLIGEQGDIHQFVLEERRAWHCGVSSFDGEEDCNNYAIGVSLTNRPDSVEPYYDAQYESAVRLVRDIMRRHRIPRSRITQHKLISPGRKVDPDPPFDIDRFMTLLGDPLGEDFQLDTVVVGADDVLGTEVAPSPVGDLSGPPVGD